MREKAVDKEVEKFAAKWFVPFEDVKYEVYHYKDGQIANENILKSKADFAAYKEVNAGAMKFEFYDNLIEDFHNNLMPEIMPLID